ncbi:fatty acid desaturase family protein [Sphingomonas sp.]|uniref:fatty acid desaturase family protein n=1 Tax=Sphingomonas sp. TaxID=28214 RepID=UPI002DD6663F|nr:fatty acid desaturase [Sphingomonas sp.]
MASPMDTTATLDRRTAGAWALAQPPAPRERIADDKALLRAAAELSRDLAAPRPWIYWADSLASVALGYAALAGAILLPQTGLAILSGIVAVFALYRAGSFIHEVSHMKHAAVPGYRLAWNLLVGVPLLIPSFLYEGVHTLHHAKTRYGTVDDPEYLPLALMKPWSVPMFVGAAALAPIAFLFRFAVLSPLSLAIPPLRRTIAARFSALAINPAFRRRDEKDEYRRYWVRLEIAAGLWAIALIALVATGIVPLKAFAIFLGVLAATMVLNQVRTLVAHLWENDGEAMTVTAQYLDSVNVPPPGLLPMLWAPVGLRYHALHHLLPGVPYHNLGEAHRRLCAAVEAGSPYHKASYKGLPGLLGRLVRSTFGQR